MKNKLRYLLIAVLCISIFAISGCKSGDGSVHSSDLPPIQSGNTDSSIENDGSESTGENNSTGGGDSSENDSSSSEDNSSNGNDNSSSDDNSSSEYSSSSGDDSSSVDDPQIGDTRTITYILNGGVNHADNPDEYTIGSTVSLYEPTRVGFVFDGWYLNEACTGERITELSFEYETNVILYAKWTEKSSELPIRPIS